MVPGVETPRLKYLKSELWVKVVGKSFPPGVGRKMSTGCQGLAPCRSKIKPGCLFVICGASHFKADLRP